MKSIPTSLSHEDVLSALEKLLPDLPTLNAGPNASTKYDLVWNGHRFPPKLVVSIAIEFKTGKSLPPSEFSGGFGAGNANTVLRNLGFTIETKTHGLVSPSAWIFRGNREDFDIDSYLERFKYIYWAIKHKKHQDQISTGDKVFIWRSKGKSQDPYGIVAYGKVVEGPVDKSEVNHPELLLENYWTKPEVSRIKVGIEIESPRLSLESGMVDSSLLLNDEALSRMQLLTARQGTNFAITAEQFQKVVYLWNGDQSDLEEDDYSTSEGRAVLRLHKIRERDRKLIRLAKELFIRKHGGLRCEVCGFDFQALYGFEYAEAHHKKPLSQIKAGDRVSLADLAIICANCHRAVHRLKVDDPWAELVRIRGTSFPALDPSF